MIINVSMGIKQKGVTMMFHRTADEMSVIQSSIHLSSFYLSWNPNNDLYFKEGALTEQMISLLEAW